jgi:prevent-host-death family protein
MIKYAATDLRLKAPEILGKVTFGDDFVVITKNGKDVAGLVSMKDLELLREIRDRDDLRAARAGAADAQKYGATSWSKVKRDLARR